MHACMHPSATSTSASAGQNGSVRQSLYISLGSRSYLKTGWLGLHLTVLPVQPTELPPEARKVQALWLSQRARAVAAVQARRRPERGGGAHAAERRRRRALPRLLPRQHTACRTLGAGLGRYTPPLPPGVRRASSLD